ncbi:MAG: hypothetical protein JW955_25175 [Sedimentisphaerales bacterium]|nr:hypothetical protein [Sedimentisphaerales bacterium]
MASQDAHLPSRVIVVGDRRSRFAEEMVHLAREYELAVTLCDDVYSAATELARQGDPFLAVVGTLRQLKIEKWSFLSLADRDGVPCCCLLDGESDMERAQVLAVVRMGVRLAGDMTDIREFLRDRLKADGDRGEDADDDLSGVEFRATEEELRALLRHETDG